MQCVEHKVGKNRHNVNSGKKRIYSNETNVLQLYWDGFSKCKSSTFTFNFVLDFLILQLGKPAVEVSKNIRGMQ
jgi:hypothetical protein